MIWEEMTYNQLDYSFISRLEEYKNKEPKSRRKIKNQIREIKIDEDEADGAE